jgi:hypothetical protein
VLPGLLLAAAAPQAGDLVAVRVRRAETVAMGPIEHALILVEGGKIVEIGEDLPVERGIPVIDRPDWVATPGLVNAFTRAGGERSQGRGFEPQARPNSEIDPRSDTWHDLLELGVTTLGVYPTARASPARRSCCAPYGDTLEEMLVLEPAYLRSPAGQRLLEEDAARGLPEGRRVPGEGREGTREVGEGAGEEEAKSEVVRRGQTRRKREEGGEEAEEKKEREEGDAAETRSRQQDEKKDEKAPPSCRPCRTRRSSPSSTCAQARSTAMMSIRKAADYLHLLDVIEHEEKTCSGSCSSRCDDGDMYEVAPKIGEKKLLVVTAARDHAAAQQPARAQHPGRARARRREARSRAARRQRAGLKEWLPDVGRLIGQGLSREAALAGSRSRRRARSASASALGSLEKDKAPNIVFWSGDPFEPPRASRRSCSTAGSCTER